MSDANKEESKTGILEVLETMPYCCTNVEELTVRECTRVGDAIHEMEVTIRYRTDPTVHD